MRGGSITTNLDHHAPAVPFFSEETKANLVPFAVITTAFIAPPLFFLAAVFGFLTPNGSSAAGVTPHVLPFLIACAASFSTWWLPANWYRTRAFEQDGRVYEYLGVHLFRRVVPNGDWVNAWRRRRDPSFRVVSNYSTAIQHWRHAVEGERNHIVWFFMSAVAAGYAWWLGWDGWGRYFVGSNVLVNVYPILLQRYTRARIERIVTRGRRGRQVVADESTIARDW
ncbi:MAG TPA: hypothetical protein VFV49_09315 [Thermoanaerobaculia bacterium]|nr:hypothetical protein [Thermoanaerobaculia bacterium]